MPEPTEVAGDHGGRRRLWRLPEAVDVALRPWRSPEAMAVARSRPWRSPKAEEVALWLHSPSVAIKTKKGPRMVWSLKLTVNQITCLESNIIKNQLGESDC